MIQTKKQYVESEAKPFQVKFGGFKAIDEKVAEQMTAVCATKRKYLMLDELPA
jgi:hypothetical protein